MTGTDDLRAALADTGTPAGVDVAAVRARAGRVRRRRMVVAASAAATVAALALAVPVALLRPEAPRPPAFAGPSALRPPSGQVDPVPPLACPDRLPAPPRNTGPGLDRALVPFPAQSALVCTYPEALGRISWTDAGPLTGVARLSADQLRPLLPGLEAAPVAPAQQACTDEAAYPFVLQVGGPGRVVTLRLEPYGCGLVSNGTLTRAAKGRFDFAALSAPAERASLCPGRVTDTATLAAAAGAAGDATLLPADTRRLLLCDYVDGRRGARKDGRVWDATLDPTLSRRVVLELNGSPPETTRCSAGAGGPEVLVIAVAPDRTKRVLGSTGTCRVVTDGRRSVRNPAVVALLSQRARQGR